MRRGGSGAPRRHRGAPSRRSGGFISVGLVMALTVGLVGTVLGVGATSRSLNVSDGDIWVWSSKPAQVSRVNSNSARVDQNQPLLDSRGHRVEVTQNDKYLLLHDLDTGKVTSVDLTRMGFTGSIQVPKGPGVRVALSGDRGVLIDQKSGKIRGFDPANLRTTSATIQLPAPLSGGDFDSDGNLWVGLPSQGTVVSLAVTDRHATVARTETVAPAGDTMALTVLDHGVLTADTSGRQISVVTDSVRRYSSPASLADAVVPDRTVGSLAAVTLPGAGQVLTLRVGDKSGKVAAFDLPSSTHAGAATPFAGRIYVPDAKAHQVYVYSPAGKQITSLGLAGATGPLELQVREDHLMINAPDSSVARVVDTDGVTRIVDKYQTNQAGNNGDLAVIAAPAPGNHGKQSHSTGNNHAGDGPPGPPIPVTALAGSHEVQLSWPTPAENGAPIRHYDITWDGGQRQVDSGTHSLVVDNLHNGQSYSFGVTATNRFGTGPQALSDPVTPGSKRPDVPTGVRASVGKTGTVTVTWQKADEAVSYVVQPSNGAAETTVTTTSAQFDTTTLTAGQPYTFTVTARTGAGVASDPSDASNSVTPFGVPAAPATAQVKQTGSTQWTVSWTAGADNGSRITGYVVTGPGGTTQAGANATSAVINGSGGTFTVAAKNAAGTGAAATASAQNPDPPSAQSVQVTSSSTSSVTVSVQASGVAIQNCTVNVEGSGGGSATGACSSVTVPVALWSGSTYTISATANNAGGSSNAVTTTTSTPKVTYTVACTNDPSKGSDGAVYCDPGIGAYPQASQTGSGIKIPVGTSISGMCQANGESIYADSYNQYKRSPVWVYFPYNGTNYYIPWAWLSGDINSIHSC
jgi:fibronectin type III domain protein